MIIRPCPRCNLEDVLVCSANAERVHDHLERLLHAESAKCAGREVTMFESMIPYHDEQHQRHCRLRRMHGV